MLGLEKMMKMQLRELMTHADKADIKMFGDNWKIVLEMSAEKIAMLPKSASLEENDVPSHVVPRREQQQSAPKNMKQKAMDAARRNEEAPSGAFASLAAIKPALIAAQAALPPELVAAQVPPTPAKAPPAAPRPVAPPLMPKPASRPVAPPVPGISRDAWNVGCTTCEAKAGSQCIDLKTGQPMPRGSGHAARERAQLLWEKEQEDASGSRMRR